MNTQPLKELTGQPAMSLARGLALFYIFVCLSITLLAWWNLNESRLAALRDAEVVSRNLANTLEYGLAGTFERIDDALRVVADELNRQQAQGPVDDQALEAFLARQAQRVNGAQDFFVADSSGNLTHGKGVDKAAPTNISDRRYFVTSRDTPSTEMLISEPVIGKITKNPILVLARRLNCADGTFCGLVFGTIHLDHFNARFSGLTLGARGLVTLRNQESALLARYPVVNSPDTKPGSVTVSPQVKKLLQERVREGSFVVASPLDGIRRITVFRSFENVPMYVLVGLAVDDVLANWYRDIAKTAGFLGIVLTLLGAGLWKIHRVWHYEYAFRQKIIDSIPGAFYLFDSTGRFLMWNRNLEQVLGLSAQEIAKSHPTEFFAPEDRPRITSAIAQAFEHGQAMVEAPFATKDGRNPAYFFNGFRTEVNNQPALVGIGLDVSERKRAEAELKIAAAAFDAQEGIVITDAQATVLRVNRAFSVLTGYAPEEIVGRTTRLLQSGRHDAAFYRAMWDSIQITGAWQGEIWDRHKSGRIYPVWLTISAVRSADGAVTHYVGTQHDITERKHAEEKINTLAFYDQLTHLPNRTLLADRLHQTLATNARSKDHGALLFIDLDNFKTLNDTQGHEMGDLLLKQVAARLTQCVRQDDTAARLGGDEFVVVLTGLAEDVKEAASATEWVAEKIRAALDRPYQLGHLVQHSSASIGATLFGGKPVAVDDLMKQADLAMYRAKESGRNAVRFFDPAMEAAVKARVELERDLRCAIEEHQFLLHYQAQVVDDGRVTGAEALVRWQHPQRGLVPPVEFIALAEESDLILPLGHWVLLTACTQLAAWATHAQLAPLTLAVNVSAQQFRQPDFVDQVLAVVAQTGANPHRLKLELTESLLVHDMEQTVEKMYALKAKGIGFSLDDFGTGYSSLAYLKRLPLDQLKIDRSFVRDVLSDPNDAAIAKTIVALAESLGLAVIAEGVETQSQRDFLANHGCYAYQGYFFSKPVPVAEFERLAGITPSHG